MKKQDHNVIPRNATRIVAEQIGKMSAGRFIRLWNGYSATTARHIARFMDRYGLHGVNKAEWLNMPIGKPSGIVVD